MARIVIADDTSAYTGRSGEEIGLGGTESSVVQLATALAGRGHHVTALTKTSERLTHMGVDWAPLSDARLMESVDLFLPVQHPRLFHLVTRPRCLAVWLIWPVNNLRHYKRIPVMWRYRPLPVAASKWLVETYSWVLPREPIVIPLAVQDEWRGLGPLGTPPSRRAVYASMPGRGLPWLLPVWDQHILPRVPDAELHILGIKNFASAYSTAVPDLPWISAMSDRGRASLRIHPTLRRTEQREVMRNSRAYLYHGHRSEAFCLAAAEAQALGVPAVVGPNAVMPERVVDGVTGHVIDDPIAYADAAVRLLTDDGQWRSMHDASLRLQQGLSWDEVAAAFERSVLPKRS
ncbi:MAG: glycosyltransferase family 4 protein [Rhizobiaceae bacterium]